MDDVSDVVEVVAVFFCDAVDEGLDVDLSVCVCEFCGVLGCALLVDSDVEQDQTAGEEVSVVLA